MNEIDWERMHIAKVGNESIIDETTNEELMDASIEIRKIMKLRDRIEPWGVLKILCKLSKR